MVKEATIVCIDNSEWMRNGDYIPTRREAQHDAVVLVCELKMEQDAESSVGILAAAGKPEMVVNLTSNMGHIITNMHTVKLRDQISLSSAINVATLALKHRGNKDQRQRIMAFVGSPVTELEADLVKLGKKLKKNNIALDIINFGEEAENTLKLEALIAAVNKDANSHLITVPPGPHVLSNIVMSSPLFMSEDGNPMRGIPGGDGAGSGGGFEFGVDPSLDPELALALRVSMEEERQRQEAESRRAGGAPAGDAQPAAAAPVPMSQDDDEAALLAQALSMSVGGNPTEAPMSMDTMSEDEQLALAVQMSMAAGAESAASASQPAAAASTSIAPNPATSMMDPSFLNSVLGSLPGVDPSDPRIQSVLGAIATGVPPAKPKDPKAEEDDSDKPQ
ncbi:proteasome 54kD subunit-PA [Capsaspora owczarzaki ATCC 30864]|uniref:26S proteasome regulatory subunit RPN10 n=1 Tax=Capsaspora owczarzaki (strain ATCC 30864) TaxID=595528 RepID=A0A0D2WJC5_CAPO3|nr:proteasome 54kD subunit-PA [Capsaspora owczarzaki ATCC 30864]KJE89463.1 proteasome 54kD subunit-PA [Capsaspora owczarzaki ATCC 30864]|eukprot:XP_004365798.1 proteasome 54kD subunit-PA [Capsaspora owczarzaki ATCC 30864]